MKTLIMFFLPFEASDNDIFTHRGVIYIIGGHDREK